MTEVGDITDDEILTELMRERSMRGPVFARLVNDGSLSHEDAQHRMAVIARLILEYERKCDRTVDMFGGQASSKQAPWPSKVLQRPNPSADGGEPGPWETAGDKVVCPKCKSPLVQWRIVTTADGGHDDSQLMCLNTQCYHVWWIDGDDG